MSQEPYNVVITGSHGTIGNVMRNNLPERDTDYAITNIDMFMPEEDATEDHNYKIDLAAEPGTDEYRELREAFAGQDAVLHFAWDIQTENFDTGEEAPVNTDMYMNVYDLAQGEDVEKVVPASSIHTAALPVYANPEVYDGPEEQLAETPEPYATIIKDRITDPDLLIAPDERNPDSLYGRHKIDMETEGALRTSPSGQREVSDNDPLFVVPIRFGGVNLDDAATLEEGPFYDTIWLSHRDATNLVDSILQTDPDKVEGNFHVVYGFSDNDGNPYSLENPFGWEPQDNASERLNQL